MSHRKSFLFFTLLALVLLTQIVVLDWGPEALFFVTWLFLALAVGHDSRISAAVGLAFLATCPFLLIAEKEPVAEQAANYAYFFLAIGILVQLEELLLERYGLMERKVYLSYLWRPAAQALERRWSAAVQVLGPQLATADRAELVRLVQIVGAAGLAIVFLVAAVGGVQPSVALPLLGGAVLFPFAMWGLRLVVRALGPAWLLRAALALVVLPLAAAEMVWLYDLVSADRLARMETAYDFIEHLDEAGRTYPTPEGETVEARVWTIRRYRAGCCTNTRLSQVPTTWRTQSGLARATSWPSPWRPRRGVGSSPATASPSPSTSSPTRARGNSSPPTLTPSRTRPTGAGTLV